MQELEKDWGLKLGELTRICKFEICVRNEAKIRSYTLGMNLIHAKDVEKDWGLKLGELARIWKGGCIIRAIFLDCIKHAYDRNQNWLTYWLTP
nr:phosphogluconate dehydrogenase [Tanacetum cinerariifolium]